MDFSPTTQDWDIPDDFVPGINLSLIDISFSVMMLVNCCFSILFDVIEKFVSALLKKKIFCPASAT